MVTPFDLMNTSNFSGQLSLPPFTPYSLLTLNNLPNTFGVNQTPNDCPNCPILAGDHTVPQGTLEPNKIDPNPLNLGLGSWLSDNFNWYIKTSGLLLLALVLIGFGLYMLAVSTETGRNTIAAGLKAVAA